MAKLRDFNSGLSHCIAAGLSVFGLALLVVFASIWGDAYDIVSFSIFGTGLVLLYLFSTLYHWLNLSEKAIRVFRKFDHIMIYILIACTYTPICLGPLRGALGWTLFGLIWGFATLGTIFTAIWLKAPRALTTTIYILMGWLVVIATYPLIKIFKQANILIGLLWLLLGGIFYTIGGIMYGLKWPKINFKNFGFHEIFHIFVILGSACHFWFILHYVLIV